jgi:phosphoglycerol transferase MdoB-like AlkP superfamily enzyme
VPRPSSSAASLRSKPAASDPFYPARLLAAGFLLFICFFELQRLALLLRFRGDFAASVPPGELASAFLHGARLDEIVAGYLMLPAALLALACALAGARAASATRWLIRGLTAVFFLAAVAAWGELEFYGYFRDRYSFVAVEYFDTPGVILAQIWGRYHPLLVLGAAAASAAAFGWALTRLSGEPKTEPRLRPTVFAFGSIVALVLFIRGVGLIPTRSAAAYFSPHPAANRLALNGLLTLATDVEYRVKDKQWTFFDKTMTPDEALARARAALPAPRPAPGLLKIERPNIVFIAMESLSPQVTGALGGPIASTPRFDALAKRGVLFRRWYSQGGRTGRAVFSLLTGLPSPPGQSAMKTSAGRRGLPSLARALKAQGYRTAFVYGGDLNFDNMGGFMREQGFDEVVGIDDYPGGRTWELRTKWGVPDGLVLRKAAELAARPGAPNFVFVMTLSNHPPFYLPAEFKRPFSGPLADERNAVAYADASLGEFVDKLSAEGVMSRTLLVAVGDHSQFYEGLPASELAHFHVPCLIYGPDVLKEKPSIVARPAGHADLAPTLLGLLGKPTAEGFWGRDLFHDPEGESPLLIASSWSMWLVEGGRAVRDEPREGPSSYTFGDPVVLKREAAPSETDPLLLKERALTLALRLLTGPDRPERLAPLSH